MRPPFVISAATLVRGKRARRLLLWSAGAAAALLFAWMLRDCWRRTVLREAYLPELEALARRAPYDRDVLTLLGARLAQADDYSAAAAALQRAVAAGEERPQAWLAWAASQAAAGRSSEAGAVLRLGRERPQLAAKMGEALERCRPLGARPDPFTLAQAISPEGRDALAQLASRGSFLNPLAEWYGHREPERSGFATREQWVRAEPSDLARRLWIDALRRSRRYSEAVEAARTWVEQAPGSPEAHLALAGALDEGGAASKAGLEYAAALKLRKDWLPALIGLGNEANELRLLTVAVEVFERAARQAPGSADAWVGLGRAYYNQGLRLGQAAGAFEKAMRLQPGRTDFLVDYANALRANFRVDEAENLLRRRVAVQPDDAYARFILAAVLLEHNASPERETEAERELRESLRLDSTSAPTYARLGRLLTRQGKADEAIGFLEAALKLDPYNVVATSNLVRAYRQAGRRERSARLDRRLAWLSQYTQEIAFYEDQVQRRPANLAAHRKLAEILKAGGQEEKARRHEEMAEMLVHHRARATQGLEELMGAAAPVTPASRPQP